MTGNLATDLHLSLNKNHLASMGSNVCDHTRLTIQRCSGAGEGAQGRRPQVPPTNRMSVRLFHDTVFEHQTKETAARTKLHSILQNNEVSKILRVAVDDADDEWIAQPW